MNPRNFGLTLGAASIFVVGVATGYTIRGIDGSSPGVRDHPLSPIANSAQPAQITEDAAEAYKAAYTSAVEEPHGKELVTRYAACLLNSSEEERQREWLVLLDNLTAAEALEVRNVFLTMDRLGRQFPFEWGQFWQRWGKVDGPGAIAYLRSQDQGLAWVRELYDNVLRGWAAKDAESAIKWLQENESSQNFDPAFRGAIKGLAAKDLGRATRLALESVPAGNEQLGDTMRMLVERAVESGQVSGMLNWFHELPEDAARGGHKQIASNYVANFLLHAGADYAREFGTEAASASWRVDEVIGRCAERIAMESPAEAMRWLTSIPASPNDGAYPAMNRVLRKWAETDLPALEQWLKEAKPDGVQDQALAAFSRFLLNTDSAKGAQWASGIKDPRWKPGAYGGAAR